MVEISQKFVAFSEYMNFKKNEILCIFLHTTASFENASAKCITMRLYKKFHSFVNPVLLLIGLLFPEKFNTRSDIIYKVETAMSLSTGNFAIKLCSLKYKYRSRVLKSRSVLKAAPSFLRLLYYIEI